MRLLLIVSLVSILEARLVSSFEFYTPKERNPCGDWEPYLNGKCFKLLPQVGNYAMAETFCAAGDREDRVLSIPSAEEYALIEKYTRTKLPFNHDIWLNGWSQIGLFPAKGGATQGLSFNNACLYMNVPKRFLRGWSIGNCGDRKHIICEKKVTPSLSQFKGPPTENLTEIMKEATGKIQTNEARIVYLYGKIQSLEGKLNGTFSSPSPPQGEYSARLACIVIFLVMLTLIILASRQEKLIQKWVNSDSFAWKMVQLRMEKGLPLSSDGQDIGLCPI